MRANKKLIVVFFTAVFGALAGSFLYTYLLQSNTFIVRSSVQPPSHFTGNVPSLNGTNDFIEAANATVPTVVHVMTTYSRRQNNQFIDPFQFFWGQPQAPQAPQEAQSSGSGVIISEDGYIVTNNHVIEDASSVEVVLDDKRTYVAEVIGADPSTDLALLKIKEKGLAFCQYGNSDDVKIGEWVLAVGNPFNLTSTVTAGIVSAKARNINILPNQKFPIESFIQTDAAVNPGNSGGALVNTRGELVGINAAIASNTGSYSGYSFAIPVAIVKKVVDDILEFGRVQRGFIGVSINEITSDLAKEKSLKSLEGVYVNGVTEDGAAASAGIKVGDIIKSINNTTIKTTPELQELVGRYRPGDKITVTILRDNKEKNLDVELRNKEGNTKVLRNEVSQLLGAKLTSPEASVIDKLNIKGGAQIKDLESGKFKSAGISEGFIITSIDNKPINTPNDVTNYLKDKRGGVLIEGIYPNGIKAFYGFGM